jgi:hypothetical protein
MQLSFSLKQKKTDRSLLPKSTITRVMSVLERRGFLYFRFGIHPALEGSVSS